VSDYVIVRADGFPLYTLTNPVDDATMRVNSVVRGEDLLSSTPRQIPLHRALRDLGFADGPLPAFAHLPFVLGEGNQKLSKRRTPEASLAYLRADGYLPEGVLNYLALLGWSIGGDRELFTLSEMASAFTLDKVSRNPARWDVKKLAAINGIKIRELPAEEFVTRLVPFLGPSPDLDLVRAAAPLVQERAAKLTEAADLLHFLLVDEDSFAVDPTSAAKAFKEGAAPVLDASLEVLAALETWTTEDVQEALEGALVEGLGLKPRVAYGAVRVAVTGRTVSPPLFESIELLGRERTLRRLREARAGLG
jgi:glutamyl-tRNA synthetase